MSFWSWYSWREKHPLFTGGAIAVLIGVVGILTISQWFVLLVLIGTNTMMNIHEMCERRTR